MQLHGPNCYRHITSPLLVVLIRIRAILFENTKFIYAAYVQEVHAFIAVLILLPKTYKAG